MKIYLLLISAIIVFSFQRSYSQDAFRSETENSVSVLHADVLIYPNPVTENKFYVKSDILIKRVEVINILGQKVKTVNNQTDIPYNIIIETGDLKKGMYMVHVTLETGEKIINKVLIK